VTTFIRSSVIFGIFYSPLEFIQSEMASCPDKGTQTMERKGYSEQPIIAILKEHEAGVKTADQYRKHGVRGELLQLESQAWWA
jgi:hypothetical protein